MTAEMAPRALPTHPPRTRPAGSFRWPPTTTKAPELAADRYPPSRRAARRPTRRRTAEGVVAAHVEETRTALRLETGGADRQVGAASTDDVLPGCGDVRP